MTRLESLPKYFRSEPSPKVLDSAFPPFKTEHRYRGVYERAGFDVNLSGMTKSDGASVRSKPTKSISPTRKAPAPGAGNYAASGHHHQNHPNHQPAASNVSRGASSNSSKSSGSGDRYRTQTTATTSSSSQTSLPKQTHQKYQQYQHSKSNPSISSDMHRQQPYPPQSQHSQSHGQLYEEPYAPEPAGFGAGSYTPIKPKAANVIPEASEMPQHQHQRHQQNQSVDNGYDDAFDFSPQPNHFYAQEKSQYYQPVDTTNSPLSYSNSQSSRNIKNLSLKLKNSNIQNADEIDTNSVRSQNLFNEEDQQHDISTRNTSLNRDDNNGSPDSTGAVVEDAPPSHLPYAAHEQQQQHPAPQAGADAPYPIHRDESLIRKKRLSSALDDFKRDVEDVKKYTPQQKSQAQFESNDYQNFLSTTPGNNQRHSQVSMVSSILSKASVNDEDAEIERELERQLQSLKTGGEAAAQHQQHQQHQQQPASEHPHQESILSQDGSEHGDASNIPTFRIEAEEDFGSEVPKVTIIEPSSEYPEEVPAQEYEVPIRKDIQHQPYPHANQNYTHESAEADTQPFDPRKRTRQRRNPSQYEAEFEEQQYQQQYQQEQEQTPSPTSIDPDDSYESVQALSINHSYSAAAASKPSAHNAPYPISPNPSQDVTPIIPNDHSIEEELKYLNFPMPKSENPESPSSPSDCPPGTGPCRTCAKEVLPQSTGSQKAIFSKTGELFGQWHRACFQCSYTDCSIRFKKGIQCYALENYPYCHNHYHELNGTLCESCNNGIEGECIENELGQKWHLACLSCYNCGRGIKEDYYLINGEIYCESDALERIQRDAANTSRQAKIEKRRTRLMFVD